MNSKPAFLFLKSPHDAPVCVNYGVVSDRHTRGVYPQSDAMGFNETQPLLKDKRGHFSDHLEPITIKFQNITFSVQSKADVAEAGDIESGEAANTSKRLFKQKTTKTRTILNGVSGEFKSGRLTALIGPSGSGKSSLLNALIGELSGEAKNTFNGQLLLNDRLSKPDTLRQMTSYVYQNDIVLDTMTPREAIRMSATLRLPKTLSDAQKEELVEEALDLLDLRKAADTVIGNALKAGISGGELKRTCVAMELITNPSVLFLDEATTGLDAGAAFKVVETLKKIASSGRTVVCSIHQPSAELFNLFDDAYVLVDGNLVYGGAVTDLIPYFASLGYQCPTYSNPADYLFLSVLTDNYKGYESSSKEVAAGTFVERRKKLISEWEKHTSQSKMSVDELRKKQLFTPAQDHIKYKADFLTQFRFLFSRSFKNFYRNPMLLQVKVFQAAFVILLIGSIYANIDDRPPTQQVSDRAGALFFFPTNLIMMYSFGVLNVFAVEKLTFFREFRNGYYNLAAYFLSKTLVELPFQILFPLMQSFGMYFWIFGVHWEKFWVFSLFTVLLANVGQGLGVVCACAFDDVQVALAVTPVLFLPFMIFGGFFVSSDTIPVYFSWLKWLSPIHYGFAGMARNEFRGWKPVVKEGEFSLVNDEEGALEFLGLKGSMGWEGNLSILAGLFAGLLILSYVLLWWGTRKIRS